jgi:predicted Zn-dependent protease
VATANPFLAEQFRRAMDSWAKILDLDWHEDDTQNCSIQVVDGERQLFQPEAIAARSQLPDRLNFGGWIAFNPEQTLSAAELYRISLHEIGHVLGLQHSLNVVGDVQLQPGWSGLARPRRSSCSGNTP